MNIDSSPTQSSQNQTPDPNSDQIKNNPPESASNRAPEPENEFFTWFKANNPLYLFSVALMLGALYLVGSEFESGKTNSVFTICSFFAVQNIYELVIIGMALYLLKKHIQSDHGKLLLILVLVFLGDLTGYQVHIAGKDQYAGYIASSIYMILAAIKLVVVVKVLNLKVYGSRIFYIFSAFILIWIGPKIADYMVNSVGAASIGFFDGSYSYYALWLLAGLIHLPLIIQNWRTNKLDEPEENEYLGNATPFWRWLMVFPFVVMPIYLYFFAVRDQSRFMENSMSLPALITTWAFCATFFAQTIWRKICEEWIGLNLFDAVVLFLLLGATMSYAASFSLPVIVNHILLVTGFTATWLTRGNRASIYGLGFVALWYTGSQIKFVGGEAIEYGSTMTRTAWAAVLAVGSFALLGLGFFISIIRKDK